MKRDRWALAGGALGAFAVLLQLYVTSSRILGEGGGVGRIAFVFLGYFTILTNSVVALALLRTGWAGGARDDGPWLARPPVLTGIATSIILVGAAYSILLRHLWHPTGLQLVADHLLHDVMPVGFVVYWFLKVPKAGVRLGHLRWWAIYPAAFFVYALIRGAITSEYPYPFMDVGKLGYPMVLAIGVGLLAAYCGIGAALVELGRRFDPVRVTV